MNNDEILAHLDLQTDIPECSMSDADKREQEAFLIFARRLISFDITLDGNGEWVRRTIYTDERTCIHEWDGVLIPDVEGNQGKCKYCGEICYIGIGNPCHKNSS